MRARFQQDPFGNSLGITLVELKPGYARLYMDVTAEMANFLGSTHGAVVYALADTGFGAAANSHGGRASVALNISITYLSPSFPGARLWATATEEKRGGRTSLYRMAVEDDKGDLIALAHGVAYLLKEPLIEDRPEKT